MLKLNNARSQVFIVSAFYPKNREHQIKTLELCQQKVLTSNSVLDSTQNFESFEFFVLEDYAYYKLFVKIYTIYAI